MKKVVILLFVFLLASHAFADLRQANYRWRLDNAEPGNENWAGATNTAITITPGQQIRLRLGIENEESFSGGYYIDLYYSTVKDTNDAVWTAVNNNASAHFNIALTDYFTEADVMNNEPNFPNENPFAGGTFIEANPNRSFEFSGNSSHELEYSIVATANASLNTEYYFIIKPNGGYLNDNRPWDGVEEWATLTVKNTVSVPTVTTTAASSIGYTAATLGGNVTSAGNLTVLDRGVVYSTTDSTDPEVWESGITKDGNGSGTGSFSEAIGSLSSNTTYYYRAYATNSAGTGYGAVQSFETESVTFTNGSAFSPSVTRGDTDQPIGRFQLTAATAGASLTGVSIKLNGARTGATNFKLWKSSNNSFGSDTQLGSTVAADPGEGSSVSFSGFSNAIGVGDAWYFLTCDVAGDATGVVQGVIVENAGLTLVTGSLAGTINNDPLSSGDVSLPVQLSGFSATQQGASVILKWTTESETNNLGFVLERSQDQTSWAPVASYKTHSALNGQGTSSSVANYTFTDSNVHPGTAYFYRLSDVNVDGRVSMIASVNITVDALPETTDMDKAYPNPFNPETYIGYNLADDSDVEIAVFDMLGRRLKVLHAGNQTAGRYHVCWNATDHAGSHVPTGTYIIRMQTGNVQKTQKVMLVK